MRIWFEQLPTEARGVIGVTLSFVVILVMALLLEVSTSLVDSLQQSGRHVGGDRHAPGASSCTARSGSTSRIATDADPQGPTTPTC